MKDIYFSIAGMSHRHGQEFVKEGMKVTLAKEPDNKHDSEAIMVKIPGLGTIGYVANSVCTRIGESWSAGRIYDKIGDTAIGTVKFVVDDGVVCLLNMPEKDE